MVGSIANDLLKTSLDGLLTACIKIVANGNCPWLREAGNRPFARRRHFTTTTRILQDFVFLCKLGLFYLNLAGITEFKYERNNEKDSGHSSKMTPSCKWLIYIRTNIT